MKSPQTTIRQGLSILTGKTNVFVITLGALITGIFSTSLHGANIAVPNSSFESQLGAGNPFDTTILVDSWEKPPKPGYFDEGMGLLWIQTAGAFLDTNPYQNKVGNQAGYLLNFPQAAIYQDFTTQDWNGATNQFNEQYQVGQSYQMTLGVFGKGLTEGVSALTLSLYYRDLSDAIVPINSTEIIYFAANFPMVPSFNLVDYTVSIPEVQAGDAWAGKDIGIKIEVTAGTFSYASWDYDNLRLESVPEPASIGLLIMGGAFLGGLRFRRRI